MISRASLDKNGIPRLDADDIETRAEEVIKFFDADVLRHPCATPILSFAQETSQRFKVALDFEQDLGISPQRHKILGMFCFQPRKILIDKTLEDDLRRNFVLSHEFGHLVLHRDLIIKKKDTPMLI